jgi:MFS family permease
MNQTDRAPARGASGEASAAARRRIYHGWWIVLTAFVCHAMNVGLMFYAWSVFLTPLAEHFGGRAAVAGTYSATQVASALYGLAVGWIVDRRGARPVQTVGAIVMGAGLAAVSLADTLPMLYLCLAGPVALGSTCIGFLPSNAAVARWFVRRRGTALGVSTAGISAGGIVLAPLSQYLIDYVGWRQAYLVLGALVVVIVLPPVLAFMRRDPADLGLAPDGDDAPRLTDSLADPRARLVLSQEIERSVTPAVAVRHPNFWLLVAAFGLTMAGLSGTLLYQMPLLIERGMSADAASLVLAATAAMGVVGKLGFGALLDRFHQRRVAATCFVLQAIGVWLLWQTTSAAALVCYVMLYGYAMGGNATLQASLVGESFGRLHYGAIASRMSPLVVLAQAGAVPLTGWVRDQTGSYGPALAAIIVAALVAATIVLRLRLPARRH